MADTNSIAIPPRVKDLTGKRFGRWTVLEFAGTKALRAYWLCQCECGTTISLSGNSLASGNSKSCGCLNREMHTTHGQTKTPEYKALQQIIQRCCNPASPIYSLYGGRGVAVCDRWRQSFEAFLKDMGLRPSAKHSIDRIDNSGNYEPGNCRWATRKEQSRNTRQNVLVTFQGITQCITAWAEEIGIKSDALHNRLHSGWSVERALTTPLRQNVLLTFGGRTQGIAAWAAQMGMSADTLGKRLCAGWSAERALKEPVDHSRAPNSSARPSL